MTKQERTRWFEAQGEDVVRDSAPKWDAVLSAAAYTWLRERRDKIAAQALMTKRRADIASVIAGVALVVALLSWIVPRH